MSRALHEEPRPQTSLYDRHPGLKEAVEIACPDVVLLIPDGNGRWAESNNLNITQGHQSGAQVLIKFLPAFVELPTKTFIPWAFSYENWDRGYEERDGIMQTIEEGLQVTLPFFEEHDIRFIRMGGEERIQKHYPSLWDTLCTMENTTKGHKNKLIALPLDFSGTDQTVRMFRRFCQMLERDELPPDFELTEAFIEKLRDGGGLVKPADAIIRTSGEQRTSDLGWLNTNSEFFIISKLLPDCNEADLVAPFFEYPNRQRRFGGRPEKL